MHQHHHLPKSNEVSAFTSSTSWIKAIFILGAYIQDTHTHADKYPWIRLTQFDHLCTELWELWVSYRYSVIGYFYLLTWTYSNIPTYVTRHYASLYPTMMLWHCVSPDWAQWRLSTAQQITISSIKSVIDAGSNAHDCYIRLWYHRGVHDSTLCLLVSFDEATLSWVLS